MRATLKSTAYHEAGHAVAAWWLHLRFKKVSIRPDSDSLGRLVHRKFKAADNPECNSSARIQLLMEKHAICALAGREAQRKFNPRSIRSYHHRSDYGQVIEYLSCRVADGEEIRLWARLLVHRANALITFRWPAVKAVATALLERKTLTEQEVRDTIDSAYSQAVQRKGKPKEGIL